MAGFVQDQLKRLVYEITADTSGVERGMDRAAAAVEDRTKLIDRAKAIIELRADGTQLTREINAKRLELDRFRKERASIGVDADTSAFDRNITRVEGEIAALSRQKAEIKVEIDQQGRAYAAARRLTGEVGKLNKEVEESTGFFERWGKRITGARVSIGPFTTNLRTLGAVLVTLGPILTGLIGSITALAGSLTEAAAGGLAVGAAGFAGLAASAAGAFFALKPMATSISQITTAQKALTTAQAHYGKGSTEAKNAQKELNKSLAAAPPHIRELETRWNSLKQSFLSRTGGIRTDAASVLTDALKSAQQLMPAFARESTRTFHVAAQGVHEWLAGLRTPEAQHLLTNIMGNFRQALPAILHGLGEFATAFGRIVSAASDFLPQFTRGFDNVATGFANSTANADQLHKTLGGLVDQTHSWFALIGATGRLLTTVLTGGASSGQRMIEDLTQTLNKWNRELSSRAGQKGMAAFFKDSLQTTEQLAGVLRRALTLLFAISRATEPFAKGFLDVANAAGDIITLLAKIAPMRGVLEAIGVTMASIWAVNKIEGWYTAARVAFGKVGLLGAVTAEEASAGFAAGMTKLLPGALAAAGLFDTVTTALHGDLKGAGFQTGGMVAGAVAGGIVGGIPGALVGAGLGDVLGHALESSFNIGQGLGTKVHDALFGSGPKSLEQTISDAKGQIRSIAPVTRKTASALEDSSKRMRAAHEREHRASRDVTQAERHYQDVVKRTGPNSKGAIEAASELAKKRRADANATKAADRAEREHGIALKAFELSTRRQVIEQGNLISSLKTEVAAQKESRNAAYRNYLQHKNNADAQNAFIDANNNYQQSLGKLTKAQQKQSKTIEEAANKANPAFAKSLQPFRSGVDSATTSLRNLSKDGIAKAMQQQSLFDARNEKNAQHLRNNFIPALQNTNSTLNTTSNKTQDVTGKTHDLGQKQDSAKASTDHFSSQLHNLIRTLSGAGKTSHGMGQMIGQVTNKILSGFGAKSLNFSLPAVGSLLGNIFQRGGQVGEQRRQAGSFVVPGSGDGDRFHTALPVGSYVLNRRATDAYGLQSGGVAPVALEAGERVFLPQQVKAIGGDILHQMNARVPRFAKGGSFAFPFEKGRYSWGRTDMGVDFTGTGAIGAIGAGRIIGTGAPGWPEGGGVQYAMDQQPAGAPSRYIYVNEGVSATVHPGQRVRTAQPIAQFHGSSIEIGFATSSGGALAAPNYSEGEVMPEGIAMRHLLNALQSGRAVGSMGFIKRIIIKGPDGPLKTALQNQADRLRAAANRYIQKQQPKMGTVSGGSHTGVKHIAGKVSWFGGGQTAGGYNADTDAGFASRQGSPYGQMYRVQTQGREAIIPHIDYGPAAWTGRALDLTVPALNKMGFNGTSNFVTDSYATADLVQSRQTGGVIEKPHHHHHAPPSQTLRLPPQPKGKPQHDFSTDTGSWYDWFSRAIDFYDTKGDTRQATGNTGQAKTAWKQAEDEVISEEKQVRRIILNDKKRIRKLGNTRLPKHLRKSKPDPFHFRKRKKGESHHAYHQAKNDAHKAWRQKKHAWRQEKKSWEQALRQRKQGVKQELPDLYQQLRVDLPTRYHEIQDKIKGQAADIGLEQTASGQERYQALTEFGGNFAPLGFGVGGGTNRYGTSGRGFIGGGSAATRTPGVVPGVTPRPQAALSTGAVPGIGATAPTRRAGGMGGAGAITHDNRRTVHVTNNYLRPPEDPHTWSASLRHELGAMV